MPTYEWKCGTCGAETEVFRRMSDCKMPPIEQCLGCYFVASESVTGRILSPDEVTTEEEAAISAILPAGVWKQKFSPRQVIMHEDHRIQSVDSKGRTQSGWPILVPGLNKVRSRGPDGTPAYITEKVGEDTHGNAILKKTPAYEYEDVTFSSPRQQKEWLKRHNMCLTLEGRSASTGNSEHGRFGQHSDDPAPTKRAELMAKHSRFVEDKELYRMTEGSL